MERISWFVKNLEFFFQDLSFRISTVRSWIVLKLATLLNSKVETLKR